MEENNKHRAGYEQSDVNVPAVSKAGIALLLVTIAAMGLLIGLFNYFKSTEGGAAVSVDPAKVFPQPQLEKTPIPDLKAVRAAEDQILTSYGWVDQKKGTVRIPIAQAMDMVVKKGLPVRIAAPPSTDGVSVPTESGLGAKMMPPGGPLSEAKSGAETKSGGDGK
jgi:hypothetical protein